MQSWKNLFGAKFGIALTLILITEITSYVAYYLQITDIVFFVVVALILGATIYNLGIGLLIALTELVIGSLGYLFYADIIGMEVSIRMSIWLVVIFVWLIKEMSFLFYNRWYGQTFPKQFKQGITFINKGYLSFFVLLFVFIGWGVIQGYLNDNSLPHLFSDFNGYLYLALIFPAYRVATDHQEALRHSYFISTVLQIFTAGIAWIILKSSALLFIFSHNSIFNIELIYDWVRDTGVGEITAMQEGVYRIFFQSHIFVIIGFLFFLFILNSYLFNHHRTFKEFLFTHKIKTLFLFICAAFMFAVTIISFSRSLWVGVIAGLMIWGYFTIREYGWKKSGISLFNLMVIGLLGLGLVTAIVSFPYPDPTGSYNPGKALSSRTQQTTRGGAAVSSRWALLPKLWEEIKKTPIRGQGFGTTVTYKSSDPRVLEENPEGTYTTFAFEWGWLGIWLKLGILGLMCYIAILGRMLIEGLYCKNKNKPLIVSLITGVAMIAVINFFTPYLNHPLGLGYLILLSVFMDKINKRV